MKKSFSVASLLLMVLLGVATMLRFVNVAQSPPGFYIDEAAINAQVICVRESGENLQGRHLPLFSEVLGGGYATPSYLYPALVWSALFGDSITSFRTFTAFFSALFILGSFVFGCRFWRSTEAAWLCALSAALSPWAFQFARIAWDPSLAPAYSVWALALLWASGRFRLAQLALSGMLFSLAAYCYPPLRVQLAIVMPFAILGLVFAWKRDWKFYLIPIATAVIVSFPMLMLTLTGEIQGRFEMLSIFNPNYLKQTYGSASLLNAVAALATNFSLLLSPGYLFVHGDANLRHSTGSFGILSWLDGLGVFAAFVALLMTLSSRSKERVPKFEVAFVIVGYLAGLLPAALTWESNPHALRSFGAVVFLSLGVGGVLSFFWRASKPMRSAIIGVAFASFLVFVHVYFVDYPKYAQAWFDTGVTRVAEQLASQGRLNEMNSVLQASGANYDPRAVAYYQLAGGAAHCPVKTSKEIR